MLAADQPDCLSCCRHLATASNIGRLLTHLADINRCASLFGHLLALFLGHLLAFLLWNAHTFLFRYLQS